MKPLDKKVSDIDDIFLTFSNLFKRKSDLVDSVQPKCGRRYLKKFDIGQLDLIILKNIKLI